MGMKILAVGLILFALTLLGVTAAAVTIVTGILILIGALGVLTGY